MRPTRTISGYKAKEVLKKGVSAVFEPVKATFGPHGRSALLPRTMNRGSRMTDDGVTVADNQIPKDPFIRNVAETFKEACKRTVEKVGDGTTCTIILAGTLFFKIISLIEKNFSAIGAVSGKINVSVLKKQILDSANKVKELIKSKAKQVESLEELEKIATISVKDEALGKLVAKMSWEVGKDGFIDVVEGYKGEIETEVIKGMRFTAKVAAKGFVNNPSRFEMICKDTAVLITNYHLENAEQVASFLTPLVNENPKIAILAPGFSEEVLNQLYKASYNILNDKGNVVVTPGKYSLYPILAPSLRVDQLEDLAVYCGAKVIDKLKGVPLASITAEDLGFVEKMIVTDSELREDAIATGGAGANENQMKVTDSENNVVEFKSKVQERLEVLKNQLVETKQETFKKLLERRIASIASSVGVIRVGDTTQASGLFMKLKIEDAVYACKAALRGGYVRGGGLCLKEIAETLSDDEVLKPVLLAPYEQIQSSVEGGIEVGEDVIDPAEAIYYAVEHATKVVSEMIMIDSITVEDEDIQFGDGLTAIARALNEYNITIKREKGQLKAGEEQAYRDSMGGLTDEEYEVLNRD